LNLRTIWDGPLTHDSRRVKGSGNVGTTARSSQTSFALSFTLLVVSAVCMQAQAVQQNELLRASSLRSAGNSREAINILESWIQRQSGDSSKLEKGRAWNLLGAAYEDLGNWNQAEHSLEKAIHILQGVDGASSELALAFDNLGAVEDVIGRTDNAANLRRKARSIYVVMHDYEGIARSSNNLAVIAINRADFRSATRELAVALDAAKHGGERLDDDDNAAINSVQGRIALHEKRFADALDCFRNAIGYWTKAHGSSYFMLGLGYTLRATALEKMGNLEDATIDIQNALSIEERALGKESEMYWTTELLYSEILKRSGRQQDAESLNKVATAGLSRIQRDECSSCSISIYSLRP